MGITGFFKNDRLKWLDLAVLFLYMGMTAFILKYHEPWGDEARPWLVVRDTGLFDYLFHVIRYEVHPWLWFLILMPFAKAGFPFITVSIVHWLIAVSAVAAFVFKAPLSRWTKYFFVFSFYMAFEYCIVARNYGLGILLLFLIAIVYPNRFKHPLLYGGIMFFLFGANWPVYFAGSSLVFLFACELFSVREHRSKAAWIALGIMITGAYVSLQPHFVLPVDSVYYGAHPPPNWNAPMTILRSCLFPLNREVSENVQNALVFIVFALALGSFLKKPKVLIWIFLSYAQLFYLFTFKFVAGSTRHFGFGLIYLIFAFWMASFEKECTWPQVKWPSLKKLPTAKWRTYALLILNLCLLLSVKFTYLTYVQDYRYSFSGAREMAGYVKKLYSEYALKDFVIVSRLSTVAETLLAYLPGMKFWYADRGEMMTYPMQDKKYDAGFRMSDDDMVRLALKEFGGLDKVLFLQSDPLPFEKAYGYDFKILYKTRPIWGYGIGTEEFFLYKPLREN